MLSSTDNSKTATQYHTIWRTGSANDANVRRRCCHDMYEACVCTTQLLLSYIENRNTFNERFVTRPVSNYCCCQDPEIAPARVVVRSNRNQRPPSCIPKDKEILKTLQYAQESLWIEELRRVCIQVAGLPLTYNSSIVRIDDKPFKHICCVNRDLLLVLIAWRNDHVWLQAACGLAAQFLDRLVLDSPMYIKSCHS